MPSPEGRQGRRKGGQHRRDRQTVGLSFMKRAPYWVLVRVPSLCVSWVRRWPRTGLANRPPLCLPDPPPPLSPTKGI
eukprot:scaffold6857_cov125-Isochrysis_galbana.AAC.9